MPWACSLLTVSETFISAVFTIVPIALATMMEHIGDIAAISATTGKNYIRDPGLNTHPAGRRPGHQPWPVCCGGPANTTYGENTGVLALTKVYDPRRHPHCCCVCHHAQLLPEV